ncbi:MAG: hypothetical protein QNJ87_08070 [Gammaproteobacteria bacterium]|nr:hypothetical protein [Gammaproteobacteria bacterium]MDJ0890983.1 hypothetical protein [Gammaproteobacteria bacterium]
MVYALTGLILATMFGVGAVTVYGYQGLLVNPWIDCVFWWLVGTGGLLAAVDTFGHSRRQSRRWKLPGAGQALAGR